MSTFAPANSRRATSKWGGAAIGREHYILEMRRWRFVLAIRNFHKRMVVETMQK